MTAAPFWFVRAKWTNRDTWVKPVEISALELRLRDTTTDEPLPLTVENRGHYVGDLLWTGGLPLIVASARMIECLEEVQATGWRTRATPISDRDGTALTGYRQLIVTGRCATFNARGPARDDGDHPVDPSTGWDGTDLFWQGKKPSFEFVVTARIRTAIEEAGLNRIEFERPLR